VKNYIFVLLGSAFGGAARYWLSNFVYLFLPSSFPYGTLSVNVIGSFILGLVFFFSENSLSFSPNLRIFLTIGFCGGFTTFSTFSLETVNLLQSSQYLYAIVNIFSNVILSIGITILSYFLIKYLFGG